MNHHPTTEDLHRAQCERAGRRADFAIALILAAMAVYAGLEAARVL